jgi:hypothetical protein
VQVQSGYVNTNAVYNQYTSGPWNLAWDDDDSNIGYPDIASAGPGGHEYSHPNGLEGQATVWIIWHHVYDGNLVNLTYSTNSLNSNPFGNVFTISSNGPTTSAVLRCVAIAMNEPSTSPVSAVWTDDDDVYFSQKSGAEWDEDDEEQWTSNEDTDIHVDVSMSTPSATTYSHVVWQRDSQTVYYARDP